MNVRLSIFLFEHKAHLARDLANSGKWSTIMAVSRLDFLDGRDVTVRFRLQKLPIMDRARLNRNSIDDISTV